MCVGVCEKMKNNDVKEYIEKLNSQIRELNKDKAIAEMMLNSFQEIDRKNKVD